MVLNAVASSTGSKYSGFDALKFMALEILREHMDLASNQTK